MARLLATLTTLTALVCLASAVDVETRMARCLDCAFFMQRCCHTQYGYSYCCGRRGESNPLPDKGVVKAVCEDKNEHCSYWAQKGLCQSRQYAGYMKLNCPKSCKECVPGECELFGFKWRHDEPYSGCAADCNSLTLHCDVEGIKKEDEIGVSDLNADPALRIVLSNITHDQHSIGAALSAGLSKVSEVMQERQRILEEQRQRDLEHQQQQQQLQELWK